MSMHKNSEIDQFDEKILRALQLDARKTSFELAEVVGLSPSSCQRRQRDLEQRGIIRGYRPDIDPAVLGQSFTIFAAVQLERHVRSDVQAFQKAVTQLPGVLEVHHIGCAIVVNANRFHGSSPGSGTGWRGLPGEWRGR